jgi:hexosaminidase
MVSLLLLANVATTALAQPYYWRYFNAESPGNDLASLGNVARDESEAACNGFHSTCAGYDNNGVLKSNITFPLQYSVGTDLYVKTDSTSEPMTALSVWPAPASLKNGTQSATISADAFQFIATNPNEDLDAAFERYQAIIFNHNGGSSRSRWAARKKLQHLEQKVELVRGMGPAAAPAFFTVSSLLVTVSNFSVPLQLGIDESYTLYIPVPSGGGSQAQATLTANTLWGALKGLETFAQLVRFDFDLLTYRVDWLPIVIEDAPQFEYRGLLIDTSRHYQPIPFLIQALDAMAAAKLNVLHLHLVDSQSWPVESKAFPNLWRASWTPAERYTLEDLATVVEEARLRGIMVLPEFDTPGHSQAVCVGYPDACPSSTCWTPLNPLGNISLSIVQGVFQEWTQVFPNNYFHAGGDEVNETCWQNSPAIMQWASQQGYTNPDQIYSYFVQKVDDILTSLGKYAIRWEEVWNHFGTCELSPCTLVSSTTPLGSQFSHFSTLFLFAALAKETIIHIWLDHATLLNVTSNGYRAILSDDPTLYLDHLTTTWQQMYDDDPLQGIQKGSTQANFVMGNEACMWGETMDGSDMMQTIWPRAGAAAERGWSQSATTSSDPDVFRRLSNFRCTLLNRGVAAAPLNNAQAREAPPFPGSCVWQ